MLVAPGADSPAIWERMGSLVGGSPITTDAGDLALTISIGYTHGNGGNDAGQLIAAADRALYSAKEAGRHRGWRLTLPGRSWPG